MELLLNVTDTKALHVPFRGVAAAIAEVIAGRVDMAIASLAAGVAHVKAGTLLGLAVSGDKRSTLLPDVPTFIEAGVPRYDMSLLVGHRGPGQHAGADHRAAASRGRQGLRAAAAADAFQKQAAVAVTSTPEEMTRHLEREIAVWRDVIKTANVTIQ